MYLRWWIHFFCFYLRSNWQLCILWGTFFHVALKNWSTLPTDLKRLLNHSGLLIFRRKKSKILRDFQGHIHGKIGRFRGIFAGKKSKFMKQSANFGRFLWEKSQNLQKNRPISRDFSRKKSMFEGFSGANS